MNRRTGNIKNLGLLLVAIGIGIQIPGFYLWGAVTVLIGAIIMRRA